MTTPPAPGEMDRQFSEGSDIAVQLLLALSQAPDGLGRKQLAHRLDLLPQDIGHALRCLRMRGRAVCVGCSRGAVWFTVHHFKAYQATHPNVKGTTDE